MLTEHLHMSIGTVTVNERYTWKKRPDPGRTTRPTEKGCDNLLWPKNRTAYVDLTTEAMTTSTEWQTWSREKKRAVQGIADLRYPTREQPEPQPI